MQRTATLTTSHELLSRLKAHLAPISAAILFVVYLFYFRQSIATFWFHPGWTTDDSMQQVFPFHKVFNPELFKGDLITEMVEGYLTPVHYWLCYFITWLCGDVIIMSHWVMLIQIALSMLFVFLAVRHCTNLAGAFLAATWFLHTRHIVQRMTAGLVRGWAGPIVAAYLYFALTEKHKTIFALILIGCLLHPPSTLIIGVSHGLFLIWSVFSSVERKRYSKLLLIYILLAPIYAVVTYSVVKRPEYIGSMVSIQEASQMPEFSRPSHESNGGRFAFLPLLNPIDEIKAFGFQAFISRFYKPGFAVKETMPALVLLIMVAFLFLAWRKKKEFIPGVLIIYGLAVLLVYFASREMAFHLYVPDRHLQFPLAFFFIVAFSIAFWRAFSFYGLVLLTLLVIIGSGTGLYGPANFNASSTQVGNIWNWMKVNTPLDSVVAGEPTHIDGAPLFGMRQAFVTSETSHPFYVNFYNEMRRRLEISFRAHYARNIPEFLNALGQERIDYFVFNRRLFRGSPNDNAVYLEPFHSLVKQLTSGERDKFAFFELRDIPGNEVVAYADEQSLVVDLRKLHEKINAKK